MFKSICINNKSEYKQECLDLITFLDDWLYKKYFKEGCCIFEDELINNSNFNINLLSELEEKYNIRMDNIASYLEPKDSDLIIVIEKLKYLISND